MEEKSSNMKNVIDTEKYLHFLEGVVSFQNNILLHMHDHLKDFVNIIAESIKSNAVILYVSKGKSTVKRNIFISENEEVFSDERQFNTGIDELFNIDSMVADREDDLPINVRQEIEDVLECVGGTYFIFSGKIDNLFYSMVINKDNSDMNIDAADTDKMLINNIRILLENKLMNEKIIYENEHDLLTGLYNRRCYFKRCKEEYNMLASVGIFFMDVNNLKVVNDKYGHDAGDILLKRAAESIRAMSCDTIHGYRMGGDEFIMVVLNCTAADVKKIKRRWQKELDNVNAKYDMEPCTVAVGDAFAKGRFRIEEICQLADDRMYEDKKRTHCRYTQKERGLYDFV